MATEQALDPSLPSCRYLLSALLAMEPSECLISHARACGSGSITEKVQQFILDHCLSTPGDFYATYLKNFLKKLINQVESDRGCVLDQFYELYAQYITSIKLTLPSESWFSFGYADAQYGHQIGSGVGLVGLCLAHVRASKVILSDGDLSTLANMKFNLELNNLNVETGIQRNEDTSTVKCLFLPWESASESQLQDIMPDVVLGADVIYDPVCLPHLVRLLAILLNQKNMDSSCKGLSPNSKHENGERYCKGAIDRSDGIYKSVSNGCNGQPKEAPVAYIACVIRNIETFNYFLSLGNLANLDIKDLTDSLNPMNLLLYMQSYNQADIKLLRITSNQTTIR
ncbi:hypothetical protein TSUD_345380 [Trifolium subterraneum]|nr:hypothetical protein TSUD_345380 [Trifolium subterraneum]